MRLCFLLIALLISTALYSEESAKDYFDRGGLALSAQKKIEAYEKAIQLDPQFWDAQCRLGYALASAEKREKAEDAFQKELELHPNSACALKGLALLSLESRKWDLAVQYFDSVLTFNRNDRESYRGRALAKMELGKKEDAEVDFQLALQGPKLSLKQRVASWGPLVFIAFFFILFGLRGFSRKPWTLPGAHYVWVLIVFMAVFLGPMWTDLPLLQRQISPEDFGVLSFVIVCLVGTFLIFRRLKSMVWVYNVSGVDIYKALTLSLQNISVPFQEGPLVISTEHGNIRVKDDGSWFSIRGFQFEKSNADFRRRLVEAFANEIKKHPMKTYSTSSLFYLAIGLIMMLISLNEILFR